MKHILYTIKEGGDFNYIASFGGNDKETEKMFKETLKTGKLKMKKGDMHTVVLPAFIMLLEDIENFDFVLEQKRKK